ncbi:MAG TPA: hypothetical protein PK402_03305, partial [Tepidisphaeraceae bacterium]|nr:hypothetical protein [Tepidisphaeraceae bacterium]
MKKNSSKSFRTQPLIQNLEARQLMSVNAIKDIDMSGPVSQTISSGENVYVVSSHASGASNTQIWVTRGEANSKKLLVNLNVSGATISAIDDMIVTSDGKVFFTANAPSGGRQVFQVDTKNGGYKQITSDMGRNYIMLADAGGKLFGYDYANGEWRLVDVAAKSSTLLRKVTLKGSRLDDGPV